MGRRSAPCKFPVASVIPTWQHISSRKVSKKREEGVTPPQTRYAKSGDIRIAYQIVGDGPFDFIFVPGFVSNIDLF